MQAALEQPLDIDVLRKTSQRCEPAPSAGGGWRCESAYAAGVWHLRRRRWRQPARAWWTIRLAADELMATLELGYLLNLTQHDRDFAERITGISLVAAFYLDPAACGMSLSDNALFPSPSALRGLPPDPAKIIRDGCYLAKNLFLTMTRGWKSRWSPLRPFGFCRLRRGVLAMDFLSR